MKLVHVYISMCILTLRKFIYTCSKINFFRILKLHRCVSTRKHYFLECKHGHAKRLNIYKLIFSSWLEGSTIFSFIHFNLLSSQPKVSKSFIIENKHMLDTQHLTKHRGFPYIVLKISFHKSTILHISFAYLILYCCKRIRE